MNLLTMHRPGQPPYCSDNPNDGELHVIWSLEGQWYVIEFCELQRQLCYKVNIPAYYPAEYPKYRCASPWCAVIYALSCFRELRKMLADFPLDAVEPPKEKP